jgi:hypothetical protein
VAVILGHVETSTYEHALIAKILKINAGIHVCIICGCDLGDAAIDWHDEECPLRPYLVALAAP